MTELDKAIRGLEKIEYYMTRMMDTCPKEHIPYYQNLAKDAISAKEMLKKKTGCEIEMTVKDAMSEIKDAKRLSKFLYNLAAEQKEMGNSEILEEASDMLDRYIAVMEDMKVQKI